MATTSPTRSAPGGRADTGAAAEYLAALFEAHARSVLAICRGLLRDPAEAEDAAQQAFLSAYRSLLAGNSPREPAAWIATIARNECRTRIRERMREPLALPDGAADFGDPAVETIRRSDVRSLRRAIAALPATQRQAFVLREFGGLSYDELGRALGVSASAVESLLFRARQQLRGSLRTALAGVNSLAAGPLALRDLVARFLQVGAAPAAAKAVVVAGGGVALVTASAVAVAPHSRVHARRTAWRHHQVVPRADRTAATARVHVSLVADPLNKQPVATAARSVSSPPAHRSAPRPEDRRTPVQPVSEPVASEPQEPASHEGSGPSSPAGGEDRSGPGPEPSSGGSSGSDGSGSGSRKSGSVQTGTDSRTNDGGGSGDSGHSGDSGSGSASTVDTSGSGSDGSADGAIR